MYVGLKQPRGDGERYVTPARAAAKETIVKGNREPHEAKKKSYVPLKINETTVLVFV